MAEGDLLRFDDVELDVARAELRRDGALVPVEPQVLDLICFLALHAGEIVTRDALIEGVWGGRIVSESAIASRINAARTALGDDGTAQRIIKTIPRRGFRFEADVTAAARPALRSGPALPDRPSVAVLPFQNMSGDPDQTYFSDGITDDIITDLARYAELFVAARHSSFAYRDSPLSAADIARELGVQYIAEGSVRRAGNRIRVTARLIDPVAGNELWAERYDGEMQDIFALQDEITAVIVNTLAGQITRQHYRRVQGKDPDAVDAYDHALRAAEHGLRVSPEDNDLARAEAEQAIAADPDMAKAHAILALTYINEANNFWVADAERSNALGWQAARRAVAADDRDPWAHAFHGIADLWSHRVHDRALASMTRAIALNPSNAYFRALHAYVLAYAGLHEIALEELDIAMRHSPHHPPVFHIFRGRPLMLLGRLDDALPDLERAASLMPGHSNAHAFVAACYAGLGRGTEAHTAIAHAQKTSPFYRLSAVRRTLPFAEKRDLETLLDLLGQAGLPE
ncbi:MAG: winged helix-turn-helix domain-containing protein [Alphaproteobacteria bacterium]|nr:winged helix-turn-helix domain-containing protein [Alphaproteobacteria bacterium]